MSPRTRPSPEPLGRYPHRLDIPTRFADNDVYGHVNNAAYYLYFDTVVNRWLIDNELLEIGKSETIGLVVETGCSYFSPIAFPDVIAAGLRAAHVGTSSVRYEIALFRNAETAACAQGHFVHVYVDEKTRKPTPISDIMQKKLREISL